MYLVSIHEKNDVVCFRFEYSTEELSSGEDVWEIDNGRFTVDGAILELRGAGESQIDEIERMKGTYRDEKYSLEYVLDVLVLDESMVEYYGDFFCYTCECCDEVVLAKEGDDVRFISEASCGCENDYGFE